MSEHGRSCRDQARRCDSEHCTAPVVSGNNDGTVDANGVGEQRQNRHQSTARPEEEGTMKPSRKKMTIIMRMNSGPDLPATALEAQYRSVSGNQADSP